MLGKIRLLTRIAQSDGLISYDAFSNTFGEDEYKTHSKRPIIVSDFIYSFLGQNIYTLGEKQFEEK